MSATTMKSSVPIVERFAVDNIEEAPWNVNVMPAEIFEKLLADMKTAGPDGTSPIDVVRGADVGFGLQSMQKLLHVTIHGSHRLRAAKKLGWKEINVIVHREINSEEEARLFNYRMDIERGNVDDFKLAAAFKWFSDRGLKQEEIAKKFGVDRSTVSTKIRLLTLDPEAKELMAKRPAAFNVSHMEVIAGLEPELQEKAVATLLKDNRLASWRGDDASLTVRDVEEHVRRLKEDAERHAEFEEAVKEAKFPKCPICGQKPKFEKWGDGLPWTACSSGDYYHKWNLNTGKLRHPPQKKSEEHPQTKIQTFKTDFESKLSIQHFRAAAINYAKKKISELDSIDSIDVWGKIGGKHVSLSVYTADEKSYAGSSNEDSVEYTEGSQTLYITANEPKEKTPEHMMTISGRNAQSEAMVKKFQQSANQFLAENVPRGKRKK
jgi:ParB/RepB/Spo0J family partition protein